MKSFFFYIAFNLNYVSEYTWATKFFSTDFFNKLKSLWKKVENQWSTLQFVKKYETWIVFAAQWNKSASLIFDKKWAIIRNEFEIEKIHDISNKSRRLIIAIKLILVTQFSNWKLHTKFYIK